MIFIIKVTTNKEEKAIEMISKRVRSNQLNIYALVRPHGIRGYIILELIRRARRREFTICRMLRE